MLLLAVQAMGHCEIPCGIYDDEMRMSMLREQLRQSKTYKPDYCLGEGSCSECQPVYALGDEQGDTRRRISGDRHPVFYDLTTQAQLQELPD